MYNQSSTPSASTNSEAPSLDLGACIRAFFAEIKSSGLVLDNPDIPEKIQSSWADYLRQTNAIPEEKKAALTDQFFSNSPRELKSPYTHFDASLAAFFINLYDILLFQELRIYPRVYSRATEWLGSIRWSEDNNQNLKLGPILYGEDQPQQGNEKFEAKILKNELALNESDFKVFEKYAKADAEFNKYTIAEGALVFLNQFQENMRRALQNLELVDVLQVIKPSLVMEILYEMSVHYMGSYIQTKITDTVKFSTIFLATLNKLTNDFLPADERGPFVVLDSFVDHVKFNISLGVTPAITREERDRQSKIYTPAVKVRDGAEAERDLLMSSSAIEPNISRVSLIPANHSIVATDIGGYLEQQENEEHSPLEDLHQADINLENLAENISNTGQISQQELHQFVKKFFINNLPYLRKLSKQKLAEINPKNPDEFYQIALHRLWDSLLTQESLNDSKFSAWKNALLNMRKDITLENAQLVEIFEEEKSKNVSFSAELKKIASQNGEENPLQKDMDFIKAIEAVAILWVYPQVFELVGSEDQDLSVQKSQFNELYAEDKTTRLRIAVEWIQAKSNFSLEVCNYFKGETNNCKHTDILFETLNPSNRVQMIRVLAPLFLEQNTDLSRVGRMFNGGKLLIDALLLPPKVLVRFKNLGSVIKASKDLKETLVCFVRDVLLDTLKDVEELFPHPAVLDVYIKNILPEKNRVEIRNEVIAQIVVVLLSGVYVPFAQASSVEGQFCAALSQKCAQSAYDISQKLVYKTFGEENNQSNAYQVISQLIEDFYEMQCSESEGFSLGETLIQLALGSIASGFVRGGAKTLNGLLALEKLISTQELIDTLAGFWYAQGKKISAAEIPMFALEHVTEVLNKKEELLLPVIKKVFEHARNEWQPLENILPVVLQATEGHSKFDSIVLFIIQAILSSEGQKREALIKIFMDCPEAFRIFLGFLSKNTENNETLMELINIFPDGKVENEPGYVTNLQSCIAEKITHFIEDKRNLDGKKAIFALLNKKMEIRNMLKCIIAIYQGAIDFSEENLSKKLVGTLSRTLGGNQEVEKFFSRIKKISNIVKEEIFISEVKKLISENPESVETPRNNGKERLPADFNKVLDESSVSTHAGSLWEAYLKSSDSIQEDVAVIEGPSKTEGDEGSKYLTFSALKWLCDLGEITFSKVKKEGEEFLYFQALKIHEKMALWQHFAENFLNALFLEASKKRESRRYSIPLASNAHSEKSDQENKDIMVAHILEHLFSFYKKRNLQSSEQMNMVLRFLGNIFDSVDKTRIFIANNKTPGHAVRNICFEHNSKFFIDETPDYFILPESFEIEEFFEQWQAGFSLVQAKFEIGNYEVIPYLMESLLTAFILFYNYLVKSKTILTVKILGLWQSCAASLKEIGKRLRKVEYEEFSETWHGITKDFYSNKKENPYVLLIAYCIYVKLGLKPAMEIVENRWLKLSKWNLNLDVAEALCFIIGPNDKVVRVQDKLSRSIELFTQGVLEVKRIGPVLCVLVSNEYPCERSRHLYSKTLDRNADDIKKLYDARLGNWQKDRAKETPFNYPVVFIYNSSTKKRTKCIEIYEKKGEIIRNDCEVEESYLFNRAAALFPGDSNGEIESLLRQHNCISSTVYMSTAPDFVAIFFELIHQAELLANHSSDEPLIPLSYALIPSNVAHDDPRELLKRNQNEIIGLFLLALIYKVFAEQENKQRNSTAERRINFPLFFEEAKNVAALGEKGIKSSGILNYGSTSDRNDSVTKALIVLDEKFPTGRPLQEYPGLFWRYCSERSPSPAFSEQASTHSSEGSMGMENSPF